MANDGVNAPADLGRRRFLSATTAVVGAVGAGFVAVPFVKSWNPSARAKLAGAPVTADISALQEGQRMVLEWRGQPIWIVKRSKVVGLCTHLGCSPEMVAEIRPEPYDPQWKGGYFCPCHKSRFDMSGRVFDGVPAPINLLVPPHHYVDDNTLVIGVDPDNAGTSAKSTGAA
ncbi:ubiquinol-cytochrome c reductase iron-sulfur subunit [Xanthomonas vasicola]|nr:ubiquinol-cytochrome c reductase iron-sulfur subunit [Xanthomonas vasicola]